MTSLIAAAVFGVLLGMALAVYAVVNRRKLPVWGVIMFCIMGLMMMSACVLLVIGAAGMG